MICENWYCTPGTRPDAGTPTPDAGTGPECHYNADCGTGSYCINSECHLACSADTQCPQGETCQSGVCRNAPTGECNTASDCPLNNDCVDAHCRYRCAQDADCGQAQVCRLGYCEAAPTCTTNCDCPAGQVCRTGHCSTY
jgi:Cys-rich repeat protein